MATGKYILIELDFIGKLTLEQKHKMQVSKNTKCKGVNTVFLTKKSAFEGGKRNIIL